MKYFKTILLITFCIFVLNSCKNENKTQVKQKTKIETNKTAIKTYKLKGFKQSCCNGIVEYSLKELPRANS